MSEINKSDDSAVRKSPLSPNRLQNVEIERYGTELERANATVYATNLKAATTGGAL